MTREEGVGKKEAICPESTIESVNMMRNYQEPAPKQSSVNGKSRLVCESNLDSANCRRGFLKKAVAFTAAATVGSSLLGHNLIPESSASSDRPNGSDSHVTYCCPTGTAITGQTCCGTGVSGIAKIHGVGVSGSSYSAAGVYGKSSISAGVQGCSTESIGVYGKSSSYVGVQGSSPKSIGVSGKSCCYYGVFGYSYKSIGVSGQSCGQSCCSYGVQGYSPESTGVYGKSCSGTGVYGSGEYGVKGKGTYVGVCATSCNIGVYALGNTIAVRATANEPTTIPLVVCGLGCANLQEWLVACAPTSVVNKCGWLGLGRPCAPTTLAVAGSVSANLATPCGPYAMGKTDFAVLANGNITLPAAGTAKGMIVFVKNIGTSSLAVSASGSDKIEGKASEALTKKYASLTLISDGSSNWYMVASETK